MNLISHAFSMITSSLRNSIIPTAKMKHFLNYALLFITVQLLILCKVSTVQNGSCAVARCKERNTSIASSFRQCRCDSECGTYGDCCIDAQYKPSVNKTSDFECLDIKYRPLGIFIKRSCSLISYRLSNYRLRRYCRSSRDYDAQIANYTLKLPVTTSNGVTYGNKFCAMCDNKLNYTTWNVHFSCESHFTEVNMTSNLTKYTYNNTLQKWTYVDSNTTETCLFSPIPPLQIRGQVRKCRPNMVKSCPLPRLPTNILYSPKCENYTSIVQHINGTYYKNEYCALCNNVSSSELMCARSNTTAIDMTMPTLVSLISTTPISVSSAAPIVPKSTTRLTFPTPSNLVTTQPTIPPLVFQDTSASDNTSNTNATQVREFLHILVKNNCNDLLDSLSMTKLVVETKSISTIKRTYIKESYVVTAFPKRICKKENTEKSETPSEESGTLKFIVNFGTVVSILFTLSHLYDFLFSSATPTSTQRSFASYCIVLVISNVSLMASNLIDSFCHLLGPITYLAFLASAFWLSALSFDIACKVWCCVQETDIRLFGKIRADNCKKSTTYSLISWISPVVILFIMTYEADIYGEFSLSYAIYETCWFPQKQTFVVFFLFPLTITISINFAFWLFSAYVVRVQRTVVAKLFSQHGIDFKFHTGLIITSNLMWSTALIGVYSDNSFLWLCFAFLDATLGLLLYLSSPVKHAFAIKITAYLNKRILPVDENQIDESNN